MIKLAAFDIDGTLFDEKRKEFPKSAVEGLRRLRENGIKIAAATGRPPSTASLLRLAGIFPHYLVCSNGHLILDETGKVLDEQCFSRQLAEDVWHYCQERQIGLLWKYPDSTYVYRNDPEFEKIFSKNKKLSDKPVAPVFFNDHTVHLTRGANGGCLACPVEELEEFNRAFAGRCRAVDINGRSSDLMLWGVNKQTGLAALLQSLGIAPEECIAFGDNRNDLEMLRYAGIGVAMGSGEEVLKKNSDYVTAAVEQDGIYLALQHFQLI